MAVVVQLLPLPVALGAPEQMNTEKKNMRAILTYLYNQFKKNKQFKRNIISVICGIDKLLQMLRAKSCICVGFGVSKLLQVSEISEKQKRSGYKFRNRQNGSTNGWLSSLRYAKFCTDNIWVRVWLQCRVLLH